MRKGKGGSSSRGFGSGFVNHRSGTYVSHSRAHQHVGQSFSGYTKRQSSSTGNFYMAKTKGKH